MRTIDGGFCQQEIDLFYIPEYSFWIDGSSPGDLDPETASIVVGTKFRSLAPEWHEGVITVIGIKWFRTDEFSGVSEVALYQGATSLASSAVTGETSDGWQSQNFEFPVICDKNIVYTAAALYTTGAYRSMPGLLVDPIQAETYAEAIATVEVCANSVSANGVYDFSSTMISPTTSAAETCFYIDILFTV